MLKQLESDRFLPFNAIRINRVQQIHRHFLDVFIEHSHAAIEIGFELAGDGAVVE